MSDRTFKTEKEFLSECPCAYQIINFVDTLQDTDVRWFFEMCYTHYLEQRYTVIFKSYITDEFKDYVLSVEAKKNGNDYDLRIIKKVDNLLNDNE